MENHLFERDILQIEYKCREVIMNKEQLVSDEKIKDTLLDLANYAILAVIELEGK